MARRCALWFTVFAAACATSEPVSPPLSEQRGVVDCSSAEEEAVDEPDAYCDLLCSVPGGVDECPPGISCRERAQPTGAQEDVADSRSVCNERLRSCEQLSVRARN